MSQIMKNGYGQINQATIERLEREKKEAQQKAKLVAEQIEKEALTHANKAFQQSIEKFNKVVLLVESTYAIHAPIEKIQQALEKLGNKYRPKTNSVDDLGGASK